MKLFRAQLSIIAGHGSVLIFCLLFSLAAHAVSRDSIVAQLQRKDIPDTTRVLLLCDLARTYKNINPDSILLFGNEALKHAQYVNYKLGEGISLVQIGHSWFNRDVYDTTEQFYNKALPLIETSGRPEPLMECTFALGLLHYRLSNFDKALDYWSRALRLTRQLHDEFWEAQTLLKTGGVYHDLGNFSEALSYYLKALAILEKLGDRKGALLCLTNLATVYSTSGNKTKAREYLERSVKELDGNDRIQSKLSNYCNIAQVYGELKDHKTAISYFYVALHMADSIGNDYWKDIIYTNLGTNYLDWNKNDSAVLMFSTALKGTEKVKDANVTMAATGGIGSVLVLQGQYKKALDYLLRAYKVAEENGLKQPMFEIGSDIVTCYEKLGDAASALRYHKEHFRLRNELYNEEHDRQIQQIQFNYELAKREDKISLLEKDKIIARTSADREKIVVWSLVVGLGLVVLISIQQYSRRRLVQRSRDTVQRQKDEIEIQAAKLASLNEFKDKTFSVLSHDLRSPINSVRTTLTMLDEQMLNSEEFMQIKPEMMGRLDSLSSVLDNLLKWSASHMQGQAVAQPLQVQLRQVAGQAVAFMHHAAVEKQVLLVNDIPDHLTAWCDAEQMDIVLRNLLANAIKFTNPSGSVTLSGTAEGDQVRLQVVDTGIGMSQERLSRVFSSSPGGSTYGTAGEKGIGLGLLLCYEFVKANKGNISVSSQEGIGTTFTILLPASGA